MRLLLAVAILAGPGLAAAAWSVPAQVTVRSDEVSLADLVRGAPAAWARVNLGKAPRPGSQRTLSGEWVLQRAREIGADASLDVPEAVVLSRDGVTVDREDVVRAVEAELGRRLESGDRLRVVSVGLPGPIPEGELTLRVCVPEGEMPAAFTVWVDIFSAGRKYDRAWARVELDRFRPVVVAARNVRRGEVLGTDDVEVRTVKGLSQFRQPLTDPSSAVGKRMRRTITAGSAVSASDLEVPPLVDKGDLVHLLVRVGTVTASTTGRALEAGRAGDEVRVENVGSGRIVQGTLLDSGTVVVRSDLR